MIESRWGRDFTHPFRPTLGGAMIESRWGRDFTHPSRPALGPTQPPIQCVPGLSRG